MKQLSEALFASAERLKAYLTRSEEARNLLLTTQHEVGGLIQDACAPLNQAASIRSTLPHARFGIGQNEKPSHPWSLQIPNSRDIHLHALGLLISAFQKTVNPPHEIETPITIDTSVIEREIQAGKGFDPIALSHYIDNHFIRNGYISGLKIEAAERYFEKRLDAPLIERGQLLGAFEVRLDLDGNVCRTDLDEVLRAIYTYAKYCDNNAAKDRNLLSLNETARLINRLQAGRTPSLSMLNTANIARLDDTRWFSVCIA